MKSLLVQFSNVLIVKNHRLLREDIMVRLNCLKNGQLIAMVEKIFFRYKRAVLKDERAVGLYCSIGISIV